MPCPHHLIRSVSDARKTCSRFLDDCHRVTECDPLQALYEKEPLSHRAEEMKIACRGLPHGPIITPTIHTGQTSDGAQPLQALMTGLTVTMTLDPSEHNEEDYEEEVSGQSSQLVGSLLHAQDTRAHPSTDLPLDPSPSLASPSTPASYSNTPRYSTGTAARYSTQHNSHSPTSSNSEDSDTAAGDNFKDVRLRNPLSFLMSPHLIPVHHHHSLHHRST